MSTSALFVACETFSRCVYWKVGDGKAQRGGLVTGTYRAGKTLSPLITQAAPPDCPSLRCCAKEKEKFTSEEKTVLLFKQSPWLCNSSLNGEVQLEPGTRCLPKRRVTGSGVKCTKWR